MARLTHVRRRARRSADLQGVKQLLVTGRSAPTEEQIATAISQTLALAAAYRRLADEALIPAWRWRCGHLADVLDEALRQTFPFATSDL